MTTQNLLEQANDHIVKINGLMRNIEEFETTLTELSKEEIEVCVTDKKQVSYLDNVLDQETLNAIKDSIISTIETEHYGKKTELGILLGTESEKETPVKADEEELSEVHDRVEKKWQEILNKESKSIKESKPEMNVPDVKKMYHDEQKTMKELAEYYGVTKSMVNNFISRNGLQRTRYKKGFKDKEVEERRAQKKKSP